MWIAILEFRIYGRFTISRKDSGMVKNNIDKAATW